MPTDWDEWLTDTELTLKNEGYRRYVQHLKGEDFAYWKKFDGYSLGLFFYDFRRHGESRVSIMFVTMLNDIDGRIDMVVSMPMSLTEAEAMAKKFNDSMRP